MVRRLKAVRPGASVEAVSNAFTFKHPDAERHHMDGLRRAGLEEN